MHTYTKGQILESPVGTKARIEKVTKETITLTLLQSGAQIERSVKNKELAGWQEVVKRPSSQAPKPLDPPCSPTTPHSPITAQQRDAWEISRRTFAAQQHPDPDRAATEAHSIPQHLTESWIPKSLFTALYLRHRSLQVASPGRVAMHEVNTRLNANLDEAQARQWAEEALRHVRETPHLWHLFDAIERTRSKRSVQSLEESSAPITNQAEEVLSLES